MKEIKSFLTTGQCVMRFLLHTESFKNHLHL
jgi:hypothetical protein